MITHDTETGWGFTLGKLPYVGYATREEAATALYDLERGIICRAVDTALAHATDDETLILDWIDRQASARLGSLIVTEVAHYCASEQAQTPTISAAGSGVTIGYPGDPDGSPTITEVWHSATAPVTVVLTNDNELWVLHRDEWSSQA